MSGNGESSQALSRQTIPGGGIPERMPAFVHMARFLEELKLEQNCDVDCPSPTSMHLMQSISDILNRSVLPYFKALVPRRTYQDIMTATTRPHINRQKYTVIQVFLLAYTATNNLVSSDTKVNFHMFSAYLSETACVMMRNILTRPAPNVTFKLSALKAMAETIFRASIDAEDCETTEILLSLPQLGLDINARIRPLCTTAIAYSALLGHYDMVKLLIRLGADVNTDEDTDHPRETALDHVISHISHRRVSHYPDSLETVRVLLRAGAKLRTGLHCALIATANIGLLKLLVETPTSGARQQLFSHAGLCYILRNLVEDDVMWFLNIAHSTGSWSALPERSNTTPKISTSFDWSQESYHPYCTSRLIDFAVQRQHLNVLRYLLEMDIPFTSDSLVTAIRSKNQNLCEYLLKHGAKTDCFSPHFETTPVAEALRTKQTALLSMLSPLGFLSKISDEVSCCAVLQALAETGDHSRLQSLLISNVSEFLTAKCFLTALSIAIENSHSSLVISLIEADHPAEEYLGRVRSFDKDFHFCGKGRRIYMSSTEPLKVAIRKRDLTLVNVLFEHGFGWHMSEDEARPTTMELATAWGNLHVIRELFDRGNVFGPSFLEAIRMRSKDCIQLLMHLTAASIYTHKESAVQQAIIQGDAELLLELLGCGFNPRDSHAFTLAIVQPQPLLHLLVDAVTALLPATQRQSWSFAFAHAALASAIAWDKLDHVRMLLKLGVPTDICRLRTRDVDTREMLGSDASVEPICFTTDLDYWDGRGVVFPWMSSLEADTGDHIANSTFCPLAVAILRDFEEDILILEEILNTGTESGLNLDNTVVLSGNESEILTKKTRSKYTALLLAIMARRMDKIRLLLDFGADINAPAANGFKRTPLQKAAEIGSWSIVEMLLLNGADVNADPSIRGGATALQLAAIRGFIGIAELLIDHGADILAPAAKAQGRTALEGAAEHGRYDMVQFLVQQAPHTDSQFESAIDHATKNGHHGVVDLLRELMAESQVQRSLNVPEQQEHKCPDCERAFARAFTLKRHRAAVHGRAQCVRAFRCDLCPRSFSRKDIMTRHRETHTGAAHVLCPSCGQQFSRSDYLGVHLRKCGQILDS